MRDELVPGVYVEETPARPRPIEGVPTSTAGFLGCTVRGPEAPRLVTSLAEFVRLYGGYLPRATPALTFAVEGFFQNSGRRCVIGRVASRDATNMTAGLDGRVRLVAVGPGRWANRIAARIDEATPREGTAPPDLFRLTLVYWDEAPPEPLADPTVPGWVADPEHPAPALVEVHDQLSADAASPDHYAARLAAVSSLVRAVAADEGVPASMPLALLATLGAAGSDGPPPDIEDYTGRDLGVQPDGTVARSGLAGFDTIDDLSIVVAPDHHAVPMLTDALVAHCATAGDRVAILHSHPDNDTPAAIDRIQPPRDTRDAAFYFPWIYVADPLLCGDVLVSPSGHVAGIYARTDSERGVFKAPANQVVVGARALQFEITARQQDVLNPRGVNCLRVFPGRGIRVWGARTASQDSEWKYINVRRYMLFLQGSIGQGLAWAVFEDNDEVLWPAVRSLIEDFLLGQWRAGALMGVSPDEAFFVKVDRTTMTQNDIDNGRLIALIGVAVVRPAEFVIFRIEQWTADART